MTRLIASVPIVVVIKKQISTGHNFVFSLDYIKSI